MTRCLKQVCERLSSNPSRLRKRQKCLGKRVLSHALTHIIIVPTPNEGGDAGRRILEAKKRPILNNGEGRD